MFLLVCNNDVLLFSKGPSMVFLGVPLGFQAVLRVFDWKIKIALVLRFAVQAFADSLLIKGCAA